MPRKRRIKDVDSKCRVCLGDSGCMTYLFEDHLLPKVQDLSKCTTIEIKDDEDLPTNICHVCLYKLEMWGEFKEQFIKSNEMLMSHLDPQEAIDQSAQKIQSKRKHTDSQLSGTESPSRCNETKKLKQEPMQPLEFASVDCVADQSVLKQMYIPEDDPIPVSCKESSQVQGTPASNQKEKIETVGDEETVSKNAEAQAQLKPSLIPMKVKYFGPKRGKTTERRRASTKRWVARKKALQAATGDYPSDTDSIASDNDAQLSPVQKARAKTNADKEVEKQKRLAKALKNLETNMKGKYGIKHDSDGIVLADTDSDARRHRTRSSQRTTNVESSQNFDSKNFNSSKQNIKQNVTELKVGTPKDSYNKSKLGRTTPGKSDQLSNVERKPDIEYNPQSIRSELVVGDVTYIVTSTLVLSEPHYLNKTHLNNTSKDGDKQEIDKNNQERNTDIIDAVQLRRINPVSANGNDEKKFIERCLNIEVEGTELEALQRVQAELAAFVENDMKRTLFKKDPTPAESRKTDTNPKDSFQTLDQQLKTIVEKAIKKNYETSSKMRKVPFSKIVTARNPKSRTFSPAFIKAAMRSKIFQPRVLLRGLDITRVSRRYKINNLDILERHKSKTVEFQRISVASGKRQIVPPARFGDINTAPLDSDETNTSEDRIVTSTPKPIKPTPLNKPRTSRTNGPLSRKKLSSTGSILSFPQQVIHAIRKGLTDEESNIQRVETVECDTTTLPLETTYRRIAPKKSNATNNSGRFVISDSVKQGQSYDAKGVDAVGKNVCSICKQTFNSLSELDKHAKTHKEDSGLKQNKNRMMRCKRCHEIVEARFVKVHICKSVKAPHKCYVCNSIFRSEKMLVNHLETHDESEFNIESIERGENSKKLTTVTSTQNINVQSQLETNIQNTEVQMKEKTLPKDAYTCFVCDKKFTDEEILKDHLQKHCDDISEDEQSTTKEQYQCAICGQSLDSEEVLESHVEKHLFDDEDDNPNLISIVTENDKDEEKTFKCQQCSEEFNSEMLLAIHLQAHVEEVEIAEWEREGMHVDTGIVCMICDEAFDNEDDLSKHLDVHNGNAHVCFLCEKPFSTLEELQRHVATH